MLACVEGLGCDDPSSSLLPDVDRQPNLHNLLSLESTLWGIYATDPLKIWATRLGIITGTVACRAAGNLYSY